MTPGARTFLASFLVLFLEVALIRWMPAYIRLLSHEEYFYEWPYTTFGETFEDVLILGAGSGTDVAAALKHGVRRVLPARRRSPRTSSTRLVGTTTPRCSTPVPDVPVR